MLLAFRGQCSSESQVTISQHPQCARPWILAKSREALMTLTPKKHTEGLGSWPAEGPGECLKAAFFPLHGLQTMMPPKGRARLFPPPSAT